MLQVITQASDPPSKAECKRENRLAWLRIITDSRVRFMGLTRSAEQKKQRKQVLTPIDEKKDATPTEN